MRRHLPSVKREWLGLLRLLRGPGYLLKGDGYTVQPVPAPASTTDDARSSSRKEGGRSQKLILFIRGNAMSGAPIIRGTSQLPNPPIIIGITIKKIITNACAVTTML